MKKPSTCKNMALGKTLASVVFLTTLTGISTQATATERHVATERFTEYAKVIDVQPVYREVRSREPRQECWIEQQEQLVGYEKVTRYNRHDRHGYNAGHSGNSTGSAIVGGLIGGVIGNQLGRGHSSSSRAGATVAGAIIGGAIGSEANGHSARHRRHEPSRRHVESIPVYETREVERCKRVVESRREQQLQHYNVTYRYKGRTYTTQMPRDPGDRIELQVSVAPARR